MHVGDYRLEVELSNGRQELFIALRAVERGNTFQSASIAACSGSENVGLSFDSRTISGAGADTVFQGSAAFANLALKGGYIAIEMLTGSVSVVNVTFTELDRSALELYNTSAKRAAVTEYWRR